MLHRGLPEFVAPRLPLRFHLWWPDDDVRLGPFDRDAIHWESDNAIVFYEDGSLPMRLGVLRQEGDILHLFPEGCCHILAAE